MRAIRSWETRCLLSELLHQSYDLICGKVNRWARDHRIITARLGTNYSMSSSSIDSKIHKFVSIRDACCGAGRQTCQALGVLGKLKFPSALWNSIKTFWYCLAVGNLFCWNLLTWERLPPSGSLNLSHEVWINRVLVKLSAPLGFNDAKSLHLLLPFIAQCRRRMVRLLIHKFMMCEHVLALSATYGNGWARGSSQWW
jgi:hypothetical protein